MQLFNFDEEAVCGEEENLRGQNFLVSAVMILKKQKKDLTEENAKLKSRLEMLEQHHSALLNLSADRLLGKIVS